MGSGTSKHLEYQKYGVATRSTVKIWLAVFRMVESDVTRNLRSQVVIAVLSCLNKLNSKKKLAPPLTCQHFFYYIKSSFIFIRMAPLPALDFLHRQKMAEMQIVSVLSANTSRTKT